jgi:hypothetical protein
MGDRQLLSARDLGWGGPSLLPSFRYQPSGRPGRRVPRGCGDLFWRLRDALDKGKQVVRVRVGGVAADGVDSSADIEAFAVGLNPGVARAVVATLLAVTGIRTRLRGDPTAFPMTERVFKRPFS